MSIEFHLLRNNESHQESLFDNICCDFDFQSSEEKDDNARLIQSTSKGYYALYKNHQSDEVVQGNFYIDKGFLVYIDDDDSVEFLQSLSYARFQAIEPESGRYGSSKVTFNKGQASFEMLFVEQETFDSFVVEIKKICVCTDFIEKYTITKLIDETKNSKTCIVESTSDGKFTVRVFDKKKLMDPQNLYQKKILINEIEVLRRLEGCNALKLYEVHETKKNIYLVSEFSEKDSLETAMKSLGSSLLLSRVTIQKIMFKLLEALSVFAPYGIIHRNIKPSTILLEDDMNIKILNFSLATCKSAPRTSLRVCGTPGYMAPEVIKLSKNEGLSDDQVYNEKCDVFAVGCIFFEMLFGIELFNNFSLGSKSIKKVTMKNIEEFVFVAAALRKNRTDQEGSNLLLKLLQFDSSHRISAEEALRHPYFKCLYKKADDSENKTNQCSLLTSPVPAAKHVFFPDAIKGCEEDSDCEEDADISDEEELNINSKWSHMNNSDFQKHPSKSFNLVKQI